MSYQTNQGLGESRRNIYSGFIFFIVLIALFVGLTIFVLNHNKLFSEVLYEQKLSELENKTALTIKQQNNVLTMIARSAMSLKISIDSNSYKFTLAKGENRLSFALYDSPEYMLSMNSLQNNSQNYLHKIVDNSTFKLILPSEISINLQNKPETLTLGVINSGSEKILIHAEFTKDKAPDEN